VREWTRAPTRIGHSVLPVRRVNRRGSVFIFTTNCSQLQRAGWPRSSEIARVPPVRFAQSGLAREGGGGGGGGGEGKGRRGGMGRPRVVKKKFARNPPLATEPSCQFDESDRGNSLALAAAVVTPLRFGPRRRLTSLPTTASVTRKDARAASTSLRLPSRDIISAGSCAAFA